MSQSSLLTSTAGDSPEEPLDSRRFAALFEENYSRLWVLAAAILGDRHQAEDIVQEAAIVALTRLTQFEPGTNFAAWMSTIVRLQAFNYSRKRTRRRLRNTDPVTLDQQPNRTSPDEKGMDSQARITPDQMLFDDSVMVALNTLGEIPRACLLLRTIHQLNYLEISAMLDIPEGTAMSHVHRSKTQLRQLLQNKKSSFAKR